MIRKNTAFMILAIITLGIYFPAVSAEPNLLDDIPLMARLENLSSFPFKDIFVPGSGKYYRPFVMTSFYVDKMIWNLNPGVMHLENIFIHLFNGLMVFILIDKSLRYYGRKPGLLPVAGALLFLTHPVNTESVNWISGRSDLLAASFSLLAVALLFKYAETNKKSYFIIHVILVFFSAFIKENAAFVFIFTFLFLIFLKKYKTVIYGSLLSLTIMMAIRGVVLSFHDEFLYKIYKNDILRIVFYDSLNIYGFYFSKMLWPFPLNFAITSIDHHYIYAGLCFLFICIYSIYKKRPYSIYLITSITVISPAVVVSFIDISWTPYAERYLYIPIAFFIIAVIISIREFEEERVQKFATLILLLLGFMSIFPTINRNIVWQKNLNLYSDTVEKSPDFTTVRILLGLSHEVAGNLDTAAQCYRSGLAIDPESGILYRHLARVLDDLGRENEALALIQEGCSRNENICKELTYLDRINR